jgi:hypothetical protein
MITVCEQNQRLQHSVRNTPSREFRWYLFFHWEPQEIEYMKGTSIIFHWRDQPLVAVSLYKDNRCLDIYERDTRSWLADVTGRNQNFYCDCINKPESFVRDNLEYCESILEHFCTLFCGNTMQCEHFLKWISQTTLARTMSECIIRSLFGVLNIACVKFYWDGIILSECSDIHVNRKLEERTETRSTEEYKSSACEDVKCDWKISCVIIVVIWSDSFWVESVAMRRLVEDRES